MSMETVHLVLMAVATGDWMLFPKLRYYLSAQSNYSLCLKIGVFIDGDVVACKEVFGMTSG